MPVSLGDSALPELNKDTAEAIREGRPITDANAGFAPDDIARASAAGRAFTNFVDQGGRPVRHPTRVTLERIGDHMEKYADQLTPLELAACEKVCRAFADIAEGRRA